ncbi:MAG: threonine synthase [Candidatus Polarisedimenticolia bacterium]
MAPPGSRPRPVSSFETLECSRCRQPAAADAGLCPCGAPLLARYRLVTLRGSFEPASLRDRPRSLWRYAEVLPPFPPLSLGEGGTPLIPAERLGRELGLRRLFIKDEALNPTGSFKARGMAVAVAAAAAQGALLLGAPSAGNAGSALAAYGARAGLPVRLFLPESTPKAFAAEARRLGAQVDLVPGSIADAGRLLRERLGPAGPGTWRDLSTLREPYRLEGKKTMGYEIAETLGYEPPEVVVYPTGGGTGLIGIWKAFEEMEALGWTGARRPRMIAAQAAGCAPIVRAFEAGAASAAPWPDPETAASGLRVPASLGDALMLRILRQSGGAAVAVEDREMMQAASRLAAREGIDACPEGGAALAALIRLKEAGRLDADERIVVLNTGTGLKYF